MNPTPRRSLHSLHLSTLAAPVVLLAVLAGCGDETAPSPPVAAPPVAAPGSATPPPAPSAPTAVVPPAPTATSTGALDLGSSPKTSSTPAYHYDGYRR